jgi:hypothetical protein
MRKFYLAVLTVVGITSGVARADLQSDAQAALAAASTAVTQSGCSVNVAWTSKNDIHSGYNNADAKFNQVQGNMTLGDYNYVCYLLSTASGYISEADSEYATADAKHDLAISKQFSAESQFQAGAFGACIFFGTGRGQQGHKFDDRLRRLYQQVYCCR